MKKLLLAMSKGSSKALAATLILGCSTMAPAAVVLIKVNSIDTALGEGSAEITSYDKSNSKLFVINSGFASFGIYDFSNPSQVPVATIINLSNFGAGPNSIASFNGLVAVAVEAETKTDTGTVEFFDSTGQHLKTLTVGALPDMLTFTHDGMKLVVANEGEPDEGINPMGTISIIDLTSGVASATVNTLDFSAFNNQDLGETIIADGVAVIDDVEPEYVAISSDNNTAFVTLQENNAVAVVDLTDASITAIHALGSKDHMLAGNELDVSDKDGLKGEGEINLQNWPVKGLFMPDAIATYQVDGVNYYITANEGDARSEDERVKDLVLDPLTFPDLATLQADANLGRLKVQSNLGQGQTGYTELYAYGARSFTIWNGETGAQVFDSGSEFANIIASQNPEIFNANDASVDKFDERSDDKGMEPEGVTLGQVGDKTLAFIGLERTGGVMTYDVTDPVAPVFESYTPATDGDVAPEGLLFIPASDNGMNQDLLLVSHEDTGTIAVYTVSEDLIFKSDFED
ncbi:choice-of-anchor I family protein [Marinicella rhabdoformis]|uniref:choice-of-anchor I family protein n=1 Tax=Marinicella rhabdoformis TaxID=2580566 RepID=UPI0012AED6E3|nr:choice-of-anchor I family protein [Marinicella rhabdoformis]